MRNTELLAKLIIIEGEIDALSIKDKNQLLPKLEAIDTLFKNYLSPTFKEDTLKDFSNNDTYFSLADKKATDEVYWQLGKKNLKYRLSTLRNI